MYHLPFPLSSEMNYIEIRPFIKVLSREGLDYLICLRCAINGAFLSVCQCSICNKAQSQLSLRGDNEEWDKSTWKAAIILILYSDKFYANDGPPSHIGLD